MSEKLDKTKAGEYLANRKRSLSDAGMTDKAAKLLGCFQCLHLGFDLIEPLVLAVNLLVGHDCGVLNDNLPLMLLIVLLNVLLIFFRVPCEKKIIFFFRVRAPGESQKVN